MIEVTLGIAARVAIVGVGIALNGGLSEVTVGSNIGILVIVGRVSLPTEIVDSVRTGDTAWPETSCVSVLMLFVNLVGVERIVRMIGVGDGSMNAVCVGSGACTDKVGVWIIEGVSVATTSDVRVR